MKEHIFLASPHMSEEGYEQAYIKEAFDTNWIAPLGKNVTEFEKEMAAKLGAKAAVALSAGTAAIHMALKAVGVGQGDLVFCQDLTFSATANPILYEKAVPVFIDSNEETWNMDPQALRQAFEKYGKLGRKPKAVLAVHLYGLCAQIEEIANICKEQQVPLIEDAAESLGTTWQGRYTGTFGDYGIISFNGNKIITTGGGGMVVSNDQEAIAHMRYLSQQAKNDAMYFVHDEYGYNYRMTNLQAALGLAQLEHLKDFLTIKRRNYSLYQERLKTCDYGGLLQFGSEETANYWFYSFALHEPDTAKRDRLIRYMNDQNIQVRPIWKLNHTQTPSRCYRATECRNAERFYNRIVNIPCSTNLTLEQLDHVCGAFLKFGQIV